MKLINSVIHIQYYYYYYHRLVFLRWVDMKQNKAAVEGKR
jgi:hypothetical protein